MDRKTSILKSYLLIGTFVAVAFLSGCAWKNIPAAPAYSPSEAIPLNVGVDLDGSEASKYYGQKVVDLFKEMRVFESIVFPYRKEDAVDAVLFLSINGGWNSKGGQNFARGFFTMGLAGATMEGTHDVKAILKSADQDVVRYSTQVNTKVDWGLAANTNEVAAEVDRSHSKKIAVELANRFNEDRALIEARVNKAKKQAIKQDTAIQTKGEIPKVNTEKLDKLHEGGIISDEEYKKAKSKLISLQAADNVSSNDKLQELNELHKSGVLSDEDLNKAKKRLSELQNLDELYRNGILSEEEYNKAKNRLLGK